MLFRFKLDGVDLGTHLDLTGAEARALEKRLGIVWGELRPIGCMDHRLAVLETFLTRSMDRAEARQKVESMNVAQLDAACEFEEDRDDDLPDMFEDGLPKAEGVPTTV